MIVPGGKVTMFAAILMFGEPGAEILYPDPGFPIYRSMIEFTGATPGADPDPRGERLRLLGRGDAGADHAADAADDRQLARQPDRRRHAEGETSTRWSPASPRIPHVAILSDEIYGQMTYDGLPHVSLLTYPEIRDRLILLDGWSKTYAMTGWRMGFSVWPKPLYDKVRKLAVNAWSCVNAPAQYRRARGADRPAGFGRPHGRRVRQAAEDRGRGAEQAPRRLLHHAEGRLLRLPQRLGTGFKAKPLASRLLEEDGVATIGGPDFGILGEGYIRLSYANSAENIRRAIERMAEFLQRNHNMAAE